MSRPSNCPPSLRDELLVAQAAHGDRSAFTALVERYGARVLAVIEKQIGDHHGALDLAQEVWIKVLVSLGGFRPEASFRPWLFAIVFNCIRDDRRHHQRRREHVSELEPAQLSEAALVGRYDSKSSVEELEVIDAALAAVPEPFRAALQLVDTLDFSYDEAALSLDCSEGTVKSRVHRGRIAFRDLYQKLSGASEGSAALKHPAPARRALASRAGIDTQKELEP